MPSLSPTQLSLRHLRQQGYTAAVVERWQHFAKVRQDLFGIADIIAFDEDDVVLVQTTTRDHLKDRVRKIENSEHYLTWPKPGQRRIECHGWTKINGRWQVKVVPVG